MPNPFLRQRYGAAVDRAHPSEDVYTDATADSHRERLNLPIVEQPRLVPLHTLMPGGVPGDSSDDELMGTDASVGYANFPNAVHLMQTVFQPSRLLSRRVEEIVETSGSESSVPVHPPQSSIERIDQVDQPRYTDTDANHPPRSDIEDLIEQTRAAMRAASAVVGVVRGVVPIAEPQALLPSHEEPTDSSPAQSEEIEKERMSASETAHEATSAAAPEPDDAFQQQDSTDVPLPVRDAPQVRLPTEEPSFASGAVVAYESATRDVSILQGPTFDANRHCPTRVVLQQWSTSDADAAAMRHLSRRPPPPPMLHVETQPPPVDVDLASTMKQHSKDDHRRRSERAAPKQRATKREPQTRGQKSPMVSVDAVESIFKSVYAMLAQQPVATADRSIRAADAPPVDPATLLRNPYALTHAPAKHADVDGPRVRMDSRPFSAPIPAIPTSGHKIEGEGFAVSQQPRVTIASSSAFPRVGVLGTAFVTQPESEKDNKTPVSQIAVPTPSTRVQQPTESWRQRGIGPVHLKPTSTNQKSSFTTVVNTSVTKHERVNHLNQAAKRLSQRRNA